jgi:hypothetical protein
MKYGFKQSLDFFNYNRQHSKSNDANLQWSKFSKFKKTDDIANYTSLTETIAHA